MRPDPDLPNVTDFVTVPTSTNNTVMYHPHAYEALVDNVNKAVADAAANMAAKLAPVGDMFRDMSNSLGMMQMIEPVWKDPEETEPEYPVEPTQMGW